jgi:hypothetical protein
MSVSLKRITTAMLCAWCAWSAHAQMDRAALVQVAPSVVKIEAIDAAGRFQLGSGVIVAEGRVATNCHVTRRAQRINVMQGGVRWAVVAQASDTPRDLCLLRVPRMEGGRVAPIARASRLKVGQPLLAIGYTGGIQQVSEGEVVALHPHAGSKIIRSSNWFNSGASGGGLFDADGALVGILTFRLRGGAAHYFAAPADWLREGLDAQDRFDEVKPLAGETFWERQSGEQPYFLQAAALEQSRQWGALARLAQRWSAESTQEPEAPYLLGVAYDGLDRLEASIQALRHCLELDPGYSRSWARLASIYKRQGRTGDVRLVLESLATLDPDHARELTEELERP